MKRVSHRAVSVLLIVLLITAGMVYYGFLYYDHSKEWALFFSGANSGAMGSILDRNGVVLASFDSTTNAFSDDPEIRKACYHVTGDYWGRTGTGCLTRYAKHFTDYNVLTGTTQSSPVYLNLTIDSQLNKIAYEAMNGRNGAVMMMNYLTGDVLVMVSTPTTDPVDGNATVLDGTFINKCISARFVPGSVFKLITAAAALETIDPTNYYYYCEGDVNISGVEIICSGTHNRQTFYEAMANSCNTAFSQIAVQVGQDNLIKYLRDYGFLSQQKLGDIPTAACSFPLDYVGDPEIGWAGIGQSTDLMSPYSLLRFVSAIANKGILVEPRLIYDSDYQPQSRLIKESTADTLYRMMEFNVTHSYTPYENFPGLSIAGKTGTAELGDGTSHAWFTGFLTDPTHPYAFVVLIEHGGSGLAAAGGVANRLLQAAVSR